MSSFLHRCAFLFCLAGLTLPAQAQPRTLERTLDAIVVPGKNLPLLLGTPLDKLGCFRADASPTLTPIPCQIDERTPDGRYVLTQGPESNKNDGDRRLSARDELVFIAGDAGAKTPLPTFPEGVQQWLELEIRDPQNGLTAWIYLASFAQNAPRSPLDYVTYIPARAQGSKGTSTSEQVDALAYHLGFSATSPIIFDHLAIKKSAGGSGLNLIDRMKIRLDAKVWDTIPISRTEDDYSSELMGYIDGPVRVLRRTRNRLIIFWKIPSPSAIQDNFFYGQYFQFPIQVTLPLDLDLFLSDATLRISVDMKGQPQRAFVNPFNRSPVLMDGVMSDAEKALDTRPYPWAALYGVRADDSAGWFNRLSIGANTPIYPYLYYGDDATRADAPEQAPGEVGDVGYEVRNLKGLKKGTHTLTSVLYHFPKYTPGLEQRYLAIQDAPLKTLVTRTSPAK